EMQQARTLVVILDTSASMKATDGSPTRLDWARQQARDVVKSLRRYDQMAVLTAGGPTRVACGLSGDPRTLLFAISTAAPTDLSDSIAEAVDVARWLASGRSHPEIVVISDGCLSEATASAIRGVSLITPASDRTILRPMPVNYGITALAYRAGK